MEVQEEKHGGVRFHGSGFWDRSRWI